MFNRVEHEKRFISQGLPRRIITGHKVKLLMLSYAGSNMLQ